MSAQPQSRTRKQPSVFDKPFNKKPRRRAIPKAKPGRAQPIPKEDPAAQIVQGQQVGSKEEYFVAKALDILGFKYEYQYSVDYGRQRKGGQVLDFLVRTPGQDTVVDVRGAYWHTGKYEDALSIEQAVRRHNFKLVVIWDYQATSIDAAVTYLRDRLPQA